MLAIKNAFIKQGAQATNSRQFIRYNLVEPCLVVRWGRTYQGMTRNISRGGIALDIIGMGSSAMDAELTLYLRDFAPITATSRWAHKRTFGLQFTDGPTDNAGLLALLECLPPQE